MHMKTEISGQFQQHAYQHAWDLTLENERPSWFLTTAPNFEQDLTCKISLLLINNTSTFCVD